MAMRTLAALALYCLVVPVLAGPLQYAAEGPPSLAKTCTIPDTSSPSDCKGHVDGFKAAPGTSCPLTFTLNDTAQYICHDDGFWMERGTLALYSRKRRGLLATIGAVIGIAKGVADIVCMFFCKKEVAETNSNTPPVIRCPPSFTLWAAKGGRTATVTWDSPTALDPEDGDISGNVKKTFGVEPGSELPAGHHPIQYEVHDSKNYMVYCSFYVIVREHTCYPLQYPDHGSLACQPSRTLWGSECRLSCDHGYQPQGPHVFSCEDNEQWSPSDRPRCQPRECPALPHVERGFYTCLGGQEYRGLCLLGCQSGYSARGVVIACQADGNFSSPGRCADDINPELPSGCPPDVEVIAGPPGQLTPVTWTPPLATDNSGNVTLSSNKAPGDGFPVGVTNVVYTATDAEGKVATCRFQVTVKTVKCAPPDFDTSSLQLMQYACPAGHVAGAVCDVTCSAGYPQLGATQIECGLNQTTFPPTAAWWPRGGLDPECQVLRCPILRAPANGAMACSQWSLGETCVLSCNEQFDIPLGIMYRPDFVCTTNGQGWEPNITVPDCTQRRNPNAANIPNQFYFFTGECPDANTTLQIKELFINILKNSKYRASCTNVPDCRMERVSVTCGPSTGGGRRRRDSRHRRSGSEILVDFTVTLNYTENHVNLVQNISTTLREEAAAGFFDLTVDGIHYVASDFTTGSTTFDCPEGSTFNRISTTCAGCSRGTFFNATLNSCQACPVAFYADQDFALSCAPCPQHSTTNGTGTKAAQDCLPLCSPGHSSPSGVEPCQPCAVGSFQPDFGQSSCLPCPANHSTPSNASTSNASCVALDTCLSSPCGSHSCQQGIGLGHFRCTCRDGWSGVTCETPPDPCQGHLCQNEATCVRTADNYTCSCTSSFYGDFCQEPVVDGVWGGWADWSQCSKTCGGGSRSRQRSCDSPPPGPHGQACAGASQDSETCNFHNCPVCPRLTRPYGVEFNCTDTDDVTTCVATCRAGLVFAEQPLPKYECGRVTNYTWNHQTADFPTGYIPECSQVSTPTSAVASTSVQYGSCADLGSGSDVVSQIRTSIQSLDCVHNNICTSDVTLTGCDASGRRKRSTSGTVVITLTLTESGTALNLTMMENNTVSSDALAYVTRLLSLDVSVQRLSIVSSGLLSLVVQGTVITPLSVSVTALLRCPQGLVPTEGVCVECPRGSRQEGQRCVLCERGFYQRQSGQWACLSCPDGTSTASLGSTHLSHCSVAVTSNQANSVAVTSNQANSGPQPSTPQYDGNQASGGESGASTTLAIALGVVSSVVVLAVVIPVSIVLYKAVNRSPKVGDSYADLKMVSSRPFTPGMTSVTSTTTPPVSNHPPPFTTPPPPYSPQKP